MRRLLPIAVIVCVAILVILGLTQMRGCVAQEGDKHTLTIISPNNLNIQEEFANAFKSWHKEKYGAEVKVEFPDHGGSSEAVRFVEDEFAASPHGIGIDLFWGGGAEPYMKFSDMGLLQKAQLPAEELAALPKEMGGVPVYDPEQRWYGTALSSFGIIYNRQRLADMNLPEPKTWEDLGRPEFFREVAAANPAKSGSALSVVEVILQAYGWEKGVEVLTRSAANVQTFTAGANDVPRLISTSQVAAGTVIDFYAWTQIQQDGKEKIGFVLPEGLTPITPDGIGLLKGAPNAELGRRFIEFVLSEQGQALWVLPKGTPGGPVKDDLLRIPVLPKIYEKYASVTNVMFDPSQAKTGFQYDPLKAAARRDALKDLYKAAFIDLSPELQKAWRAVIDRGMRPDEVRSLCAPYLGEDDLAACSARWNDAVFRNEKIAEWTNAARARYQALAK